MSGKMKRREFLRASGAGAAFAACGVGANLASAAAKKRSPNFVVMLADDLSADEVGCYGHPEHQTPHLDRLARTGVQFRTCYATPICHPTRFMIMTGQYGHHNKVYHFAGRAGGPDRDSAEEQIVNHVTFAQVLKPRGYATAQTGKWQLSGKIPDLVRECGFDEYCMWAYTHNLPEGVEHAGGWEGKAGVKTSRYWHPSIVKNGEYLPTKPDDYGPDIFCDFAIDFIKRNKDRPFFVYYSMALTHGPFYTTPDNTKSRDDHFQNDREKNWRANVEYTDQLVGRIVKALDDLGLRENTILFFTGDNGTGGFGKGQTTERGARVPGIANCPGIVKALGQSDALVDLSDVLPTLAEFAGAELPQDRPIDGRSFAPILRGEKRDVREWIYVYLGGQRVLRDKRWLLENNSPKQFGQFYDCGASRDGTNYKDVTDSQDPEVLAAKARFEKILADNAVPDVSDGAPPKGRKKSGGQQPKGKLASAGAWSAAVLSDSKKWVQVASKPKITADAKGLRVEVGAGEKRAVAGSAGFHELPAGAKTMRVRVAELSPGAGWFCKLVGKHDDSGIIGAAQTFESRKAGEATIPINAKVRDRLGQPWQIKIGLTGNAGAYVVFESVRFD